MTPDASTPATAQHDYHTICDHRLVHHRPACCLRAQRASAPPTGARGVRRGHVTSSSSHPTPAAATPAVHLDPAQSRAHLRPSPHLHTHERERTHVLRGTRGEPCHLRHNAANARALRRRTHHHHRPDRRCGIAGANDPPVDRTRTRIKNRERRDCAPTSQERACRSASKRKLSPSIAYARGEGRVLGHFSARSSRNDRLSHSKKVTPTSAILG